MWGLAWLRTQQSSLVVVRLAAAQPSRPEPPEQAMHLLVKVTDLHRQGRRHDIGAGRCATSARAAVRYTRTRSGKLPRQAGLVAAATRTNPPCPADDAPGDESESTPEQINSYK